ncbi:hypothetical protein OG848_46960 (plasmid) [Streptomyces canus]|uniref:hypothetical protein n=1 Tax=Streptomyces canus TaxID=58343 RepID=UPI002F91215C
MDDPPGLVQALLVRSFVHGMTSREVGRALSSAERDAAVDHVASKLLVTHRSQRWREAVSTALLGDWCEPLWDSVGAADPEVFGERVRRKAKRLAGEQRRRAALRRPAAR